MGQSSDVSQLVKSLMTSEIFKDVKAEQIEEIDDIISRVPLSEGEILLEEGTESHSFYVVESGDVEVFFSVPGEDNFVEACRLRVGSVVGEMALLENDVHSARVVAKTPSSVIQIDSAAFLMYLETHPEVGYAVMRNLARIISQRLRYTDQFVRHIASN
ncbi:MAG: cyclic nucleotide-binding domain-containing protein [Fibrobacter sp.]|nr:cyclic nucleotide-binding domain-containing protein [Fibrobacter sp.]